MISTYFRKNPQLKRCFVKKIKYVDRKYKYFAKPDLKYDNS